MDIDKALRFRRHVSGIVEWMEENDLEDCCERCKEESVDLYWYRGGWFCEKCLSYISK